MRKPIIGIDLDDVLWDFLDAWVARYNDVTGDNLKAHEVKSWDIGEYITKATKEMMFYMLEQKDFWGTVNLKRGAFEYLEKLISNGYDVIIVTASYYKTLQYKLERLFNLLPYLRPEQVMIAHRKQLVDLDMLIDDNPKNLKGGQYKKVLFNAHHNQGCDENGIDAVRVNDWEELYMYITECFPIGGR